MQRILSSKEVVKILGISRTTLYRLTKNNQLRNIKISDQRVGWPESEIERFIGIKIEESYSLKA